MKIKNITDLKLQNSFYQLNLIKGFKFVDKAGEIVNLYYEDGKPPTFNLAMDGLNLKSPEQYIEILKYSSDRLWIKFDKIDTIDQVIQFIGKPINITKNIQKVEIISRIGWRNFFLIESMNTQEVNNIEKKVEIIPNTDTLSFKIAHSESEINSVIDIELLISKKEKDKKALQINVDAFIQENIKIDDVVKRTKEIVMYFKNDFVKLINHLLGEK